jgi:hypothetical protein
MTQIKIYVVDEQKSIVQLEEIKKELCSLYGGLSKYPNVKGLWLGPNGIECDNVTVYEIWTDKPQKEKLREIALRIKELTQQKAQLYTINFKSYFV